MSALKRMTQNSAVNFVGLGMNALLQIAQVPMFTSVWSLEKYGTWIVLSTIPTYFALSDLGFATASTSDMTMSHARGDTEKTRMTYQSTWALMTAVSMVFLLLVSPILCLQGATLPYGYHWVSDYALTIFLFALYSAVALCSRVVLAGFRSTGFYGPGSFSYEFLNVIEGLLVVAAAWMGWSFNMCITLSLIWRLMTISVLNLVLGRLVPGMCLGYALARRSEIRRLLYPAVTAMTVPITLAINIQGIVLVVGAVLSPQAVAIITPVRTASRLVLQMVSAINRGSMPEMARAASTENNMALKQVLKLNLLSVFFVLLPGAIVFAVFGGSLVKFWTHGRINPESTFVALMAAAMFLQGAWFFTSNLLMAVNRHTEIAKYLLMVSIVSVIAAIPAGRFYGLDAIAMVLVFSELASTIFVLNNASKNKLFFIS